MLQFLLTQIGGIKKNVAKAIKQGGDYTGSVDANKYTDIGIYHLGISTNSPYGESTAYCILLVMKISNAMIAQIAITTTNRMFYRQYSSNVWGEWREVSAAT